MDTIRILIADDHPMFRKGVRAILALSPNFDIVAEAANGEEAVTLAETHQPDVILMDVAMPGMHGIEAARRILRDSPHIHILMMTMSEDDETIFAALQSGARGYVVKGVDQEDLLRAITAVSRGEAIFSPTIARKVLDYFASARHTILMDVFPELTRREFELLTLLTQGLDNSEIAERLSLSPKTVRNHLSNVFSKLQVADRAEAILRAREAGLGST